MNNAKNLLKVSAAALVLALSASTANAFSSDRAASVSLNATHQKPLLVTPRIGNGSDTASFYYKLGVKNYEKGDLIEAEQAFEAVLRAKGLNQEAHHYLAFIAYKNNDDKKVEKHVKAYHGLLD